MRVQRADDVDLLSRLAGPGTEQPCVLDGSRPAYLIPHGSADLFAVRRSFDSVPMGRGRFLTTIGPGAVVPSATVLGAWQLVLAPSAGTCLLPLSARWLRAVGYGGLATIEPAPRADTVITALARGLDVALLALADALRGNDPPAHSVMIGTGQIASLGSGTAVTGAGGVGWVRVAGGHATRNGDPAAVFGSGEPALLAGRDWIVVNGPTTVEWVSTADLLAAGHLPAALDSHTALTLRRIADRR